jgi:predicted dehydrogenase
MSVDMCKSAVAMGGLYRWRESREVPDTINASLEYPQGFLLNMSATFNNSAAPGGGIQFLGTEGTLELTGGKLTFIPEIVNENNSWIVQSWPSKLEKAYYADPKIKKEEMPWTRDPALITGSETYHSEGLGATLMHFHEFFDAVRNGTPTKEDAVVGHHAASCAHMVNLSIDKKRVVYWNKAKDTVVL